jgi:Tfp pilus assembly protein FimV
MKIPITVDLNSLFGVRPDGSVRRVSMFPPSYAERARARQLTRQLKRDREVEEAREAAEAEAKAEAEAAAKAAEEVQKRVTEEVEARVKAEEEVKKKKDEQAKAKAAEEAKAKEKKGQGQSFPMSGAWNSSQRLLKPDTAEG